MAEAKAGSRQTPAENLLDYIPHRNLPWDAAADGLVTLRVARFSGRLLQKYLMPHLKHPHIAVHLDAFGSWVWQHMDGRLTVREMAAGLEQEFGDKIKPVHQRLGKFINMLVERSYVTLVKPAGQRTGPSGAAGEQPRP
ncbi:MAG TPA: PqqD family protein [bacterium]|nr:PqqD family protein [bacterium]HOC25750.1 PqqD family protein [bacterium]HOH07300.1 PqqD family protein [bacterium]HOY44523.1 PqqD family protein [bacterium]HPG82222.1 PqqD family protein [bacterium]